MKVITISLDLIDEDLEQPRSSFDEESLNALVQSIKEVGLLNPIKVRTIENGRYKVIFGNRRYKAHRLLGYTTIDAILSENESEQDIYIQQLTENIQRENFNPIEEAEAFKRALENSSWNISIKYLSNKLGRNERYISNKLSLLNFGKSVRQIMHNSTEIKPNKLNEQQILPLKDLPIEYRDQVALKVASEEIPVEDVKKISKLFLAKDIEKANKENFLNYKKYKLIEIWDSYESELKRKREEEGKLQIPIKPELVSDNFTGQTSFSVTGLLPIEEKIKYLLSQIPPAIPVPKDIIMSYKDMNLGIREDFMLSIDCLIENLEEHIKQWKEIKDIVIKDGIRRIK